jgi:hypothetical protein
MPVLNTPSLALDAGQPVRVTPWPRWPHYEDDERAAAAAVLASGRVNYWTGDQCRQFEREPADGPDVAAPLIARWIRNPIWLAWAGTASRRLATERFDRDLSSSGSRRSWTGRPPGQGGVRAGVRGLPGSPPCRQPAPVPPATRSEEGIDL